ncbi:MAG: hypothetical protein RR945_05700 [Erysipelotrichaceae bacterium]
MQQMMSDGGGSSYDIAVYDDLFEIAAKTKVEFETQFKTCYDELNRIFKEMKNAEGFRSTACEGFLETFDILLMYQKDLIKELPEFYESFSDFGKSLNDIYSHHLYKGLGE